MGRFSHLEYVKFTKAGAEVKKVINARVEELQGRLRHRYTELDAFMADRDLMRTYLIRERNNDWPHGGQMRCEMPSEEHQRVTELCRRIGAIEADILRLRLVHDNVRDDQELQLDVEDLASIGYGLLSPVDPLMC